MSRDFDGVDDFISAGDVTILDGATAYTMMAWVYPDAISGTPKVIAKNNPSPDFSFQLGFQIVSGTNRFFFHAFQDTSNESLHRSTSANPISTGLWSHLVGVWNGGTSWNFYLNGLAISNEVLFDAGSPTSIANGGSPLFFGADKQSGTSSNNFDG